MLRVASIAELRGRVRDWREQGLRIGFVPTMGNLHAGHLALVEQAHRHCQRVVASIFVNPTQFGPNEDYARYPRTLEADAERLQDQGCDLLFEPTVETLYPFGLDSRVRIGVPGLDDILEGAHRPGHFDGVATVVARLFNLVQPDLAVFGRKDYQQLQIIRRLVADLAIPVEVLAGDTVREPDGLAMSSRNQYLDPAQRARAPALSAALLSLRSARRKGVGLAQLEDGAVEALRLLGFEVDYVAIRRADLSSPDSPTEPGLVALAAARLGRTRLIDNIDLDEPGPGV
jgi:pantoate--beta-alanine ligase